MNKANRRFINNNESIHKTGKREINITVKIIPNEALILLLNIKTIAMPTKRYRKVVNNPYFPQKIMPSSRKVGLMPLPLIFPVRNS